MRVQDAVAAVRAFARQHQLARCFAIEVRAPAQQFFDAQRTLFHQHPRGLAIHQPIAGVDRVFQMQRDVLIAAHGDGDAALRVVGVRFAQRLLGDHQDPAGPGQPNSGAKSGNARADDEKIGYGRNTNCISPMSRGYHSPASGFIMPLLRLRYDGPSAHNPRSNCFGNVQRLLGDDLLADLPQHLRDYLRRAPAALFVLTSPEIWSLWSEPF